MSCRLTPCSVKALSLSSVNQEKTVAIGADHRGFVLKEKIQQALQEIMWIDVGTFSQKPTDYPEYAQRLCALIQEGPLLSGILVCGSGVGMSIAANRHVGIYAALCCSPEMAQAAKADDNANVLVLPADYLTLDQALASITIWRATSFKGGKYAQRLAQIDGEADCCSTDVHIP